MPLAAPTACIQPGCPHLRPCPVHKRRWDRENGTPAERGYDRAWRRLRAMKLLANPFCEIKQKCTDKSLVQQLANEVDHIIPIRERPDLRLVWSNLQSACGPCHRWKSVTQDGGFGR